MRPEPNLLAFDTSAAHCAAALLCGDVVLSERFEPMKRGQAERLMPMLEEVLQAEGAVWEELHAIGVGIGPGNFTGIRISVSAARGLALALGIPAIGVSAFEIARGPASQAAPEYQIVTQTGLRDTVFLQHFQAGRPSGEPYTLASGHHDWMQIDLEIPPKGTELLGPFAENLMLAFGMGAPGLYPFNTSDIDWPRAPEIIGRVALEKLRSGQHIEAPKPLYIRAADAAPASDPPPVILP